MNIILGVDGSASSIVACDLVAATAWPPGTHVRLVAVYESPADWPGFVPEAALLDTQAARLQARGLATESVVRRGRVASVLLEMAEEPRADLIVVGSRGHGVTASALLGSTSATLADHAPCPVLVARRPFVRRMLLATDASESAQTIPHILGVWGVFRGVPVDAVSVAPTPPTVGAQMSPLAGARHVPRERLDDAYDHHRSIADTAACRLTALGLPSTARVLVGNPAREIERVAAETDVDLIVTGSRGLGQLQRLLLGSVAHHVLLHAHCSVLVMRGHVPGRVREPEGVAAASI